MMLRPLVTIGAALLLALAGTAFADAHASAHEYSVEVMITDIVMVGMVPGGVRGDGAFAGTITDGLFAGSTVDGIDRSLIREDGALVIDVRMRILVPDALPVAVTMKGFWVAPFEMPLEALLDPEAGFPDADIPGHGVVWHETMLPEYQHLNHTLFSFTGIINLGRGTVRWTSRSMVE
jgi:hypothetical protein